MTQFVAIYHPLNADTIANPARVSLDSVDDWQARGWVLVDPEVTPPAPSTPYYTRAELLSQIQTGAEPIGGALKAAFGSLVPITRFGAATGNTAAQNAAALASAVASGEALWVPPGTFYTDPLTVDGPVTILGAGRGDAILRCTGDSVLSVAGSGLSIQGVRLRSDGGGATVVQHGNVDQGTLDRIGLVQAAADQSIWDNAGFNYVDMRVTRFYSEHRQDATVPGWKLVGAAGTINDNVWEKGRAQYSGEYHFLVESTSAGAHYSATFRDLTFEVCTGGGIRLISMRDYEIANCVNWDIQAGTPSTGQRTFYSLERNASSITCTGTLRRLQRLAGANAASVYDVSLPAGGSGGGTVIDSCRNVSTGDPFTIDLKDNAVFVVSLDSAGRTSLINAGGAVVVDVLGFSIGGKKIRQGTAAPTTGTWAVGDKVWNTAPAAGGFEGWICTTGGTPGTWKTFGAISA